jgi:hypothetical protein
MCQFVVGEEHRDRHPHRDPRLLTGLHQVADRGQPTRHVQTGRVVDTAVPHAGRQQFGLVNAKIVNVDISMVAVTVAS